MSNLACWSSRTGKISITHHLGHGFENAADNVPCAVSESAIRDIISLLVRVGRRRLNAPGTPSSHPTRRWRPSAANQD